MRAVIPKEFDFEREARLMGALRVRLARSAPRLVVPEPVMPLCGPGCIVMQRLYGACLFWYRDMGPANIRVGKNAPVWCA